MSHLILLATEAVETAEGGGGGLSSIAIILLLAGLGAFAVAYFVVGPGKSRGPKTKTDIPLAMRPYHSDEELETTGLERAMAWGVALAVFMAIFIPLYWVIEPDRIDAKMDEFYEQDVAKGRVLYAQNCTNCHGDNAQGGFAPHPDPNVTAAWPAPALDNIVARYEDSVIVEDIEEFITRTLLQGRAGTPMPAWGAAYQGPMNDQQIEALTKYLLSIQTGEVPEAQAYVGASGQDVFMDNCARCHGQQAEGRVGPSLTEVFYRYGAVEGDDEAIASAADAIRSTLYRGRQVPTGAPMPSFADVLSDGAIEKVIEYLQSIQQPALR
ncbi:MAG: c-type cytochrome [Actinomycetes bacterium]